MVTTRFMREPPAISCLRELPVTFLFTPPHCLKNNGMLALSLDGLHPMFPHRSCSRSAFPNGTEASELSLAPKLSPWETRSALDAWGTGEEAHLLTNQLHGWQCRSPWICLVRRQRAPPRR